MAGSCTFALTCILHSRFEHATTVYICTACCRIQTIPVTYADHFADCTVVRFDDSSTDFYVGHTVVLKNTKIYQCDVCGKMFCLKYYVLLHLTEKHFSCAWDLEKCAIPSTFVSMTVLISEMSN